MKPQRIGVATCLAAVTTALLAGSARPLSPTAGLIAFTRADDIYVMNADGSGVRPLWRGARAVTDLAWSPDGGKLAFGTWGGRVRVMNADGSGVVPIASVLARSLSWSPDGRRMVFTRWYKSVGPDIWVMDADGSHIRRLARTQGWESAVAWSPSGDKIAFTTSGWCQDVYVMSTSGRNLRRLTPDGCNTVGDLDWSPDGRRIVFAHEGGVWVTDADSRSRVRLRHNGDLPVWSPDGRKIAFVRRLDPRREASTEIFVMNADGTGVTRLTHNEIREAALAWQSKEES